MTDTPQLLLVHHLKTLKLPTFLREYDKLARQCAAEGADHVRYLVRLAELELIDRERRMVERRIRQARFPAVKSLDSFDFKAIPSLNKMLVVELARCEYVERRENTIALGNSGTGKTHIALGLGLAACQKGLSVGFTTAAALVHELMEARDEKRLLRFQKQLAKYSLLVIDELGFVPLSKTGAELLFEVFSQRYERGATLVTSNLPFDEWTEIFGSIGNMGGESQAAWRQFLDDLDARGLKRPGFVIVDGAPGLEAALSALWGDDLPVQRCTVHKHRNLLGHAPKHMHDELSEDYRDMVYADTASEVETRHKAFVRKWRLKCRAVADSLAEAGDKLFTFTRLSKSQWKSARTTNAIERLNEAFKRRIKTQTVLPCPETVPMLLWALLASGQIQMRKVDGWETLDQLIADETLDRVA